jgi:hypothetical protein
MVAGFDMTQWEFYFFLALLLAGNGACVVIQQLGFQKGQAVALVPLYTVLSLVLPVLAGVWLFYEWVGDMLAIIAINVIAIVGVSLGAAILSFFNARQETAKNELVSSPTGPNAVPPETPD